MYEIEEYKNKMNLTDDDIGWYWLDSFRFLTIDKKSNIYHYLKKGSELFNLEKYKDFLLKMISEEEYKIMVNCANNTYIETLWQSMKNVIDFISINNDKYPDGLKELSNPPVVLYYRGHIELLKEKSIAVSGTRLFDNYGQMVTEKFVREFVRVNLPIVTGLNEGLDRIAHETAIKYKGPSIAVLSGGINKIYPTSNTRLVDGIIKDGLVVSEWPPETPSLNYMFPIRGRIIAGISSAMVVTEAGINSGLKYQIDYAIDKNLTIYAIPGNITSYRSSLPNSLIKSCQSMMVTNAEEILEDMSIVYEPIEHREEADEEEKKIFEVLNSVEEAHFNYIVEKTGIPVNTLMGLLTGLEIKNKVKRLPGNMYVKID